MFEEWNKKHHISVEKDITEVSALLDEFVSQVSLMLTSVKIDPNSIFKFKNHKALNSRVDKLLKNLSDKIGLKITGLSRKHWDLSNKKNDAFLRVVKSPKQEHYKHADFDKFRKDRVFSKKIWKYSKQLKQEMEMAIDIAIKDGTPANELATTLKKYLHNPDKLFRRYKDANGVLQLSKNARAYKPGQGIYRSSYKNALRLARTEINIAYHIADLKRWSTIDFVIGYEVKRSKHPYPCSVCSALVGRYPKTFVFFGWHPNCRCYMVPILRAESELFSEIKPIYITSTPKGFNNWVQINKEQIKRAKHLPYFLKYNKEYVAV